MFDPTHPGYARTPNGQPEYDSVLITIDSVVANAPGTDVIQKFVMSSQSAVAALMGNISYFNEHELLAHSPKTIELLQAAGREANPIYVYTPGARGVPVCVQVIMSAETFMGLVEHPDFGAGSMMMTAEKIEETVARLTDGIVSERGGYPPLFFFSPSLEPAALAEDPAPGLAEELASQDGADRRPKRVAR